MRHRGILGGAALAVLLTACGATEAVPPLDLQEQSRVEQLRGEALGGLWMLSEGGEELGSLRITRGRFTEGPTFGALLDLSDPSDPPVPIELAFRQGELGGVSAITSSVSVSVSLRPVDGRWEDPHASPWRTNLYVHLLRGERSSQMLATRLTLDCPICESEATMGDAFCGGCGLDLLTSEQLDVRVHWRRGAPESFTADALRRALARHCKRRHKVVVTDCDFRLWDTRFGIGRLALWSVLGIFSGFQTWEYRLSCVISIDDEAPVIITSDRIELDFFERNEGARELFLAAFSWIYPAPLFEDDPAVTAQYAIRRIVRASLKVMDRP